MECFHCALAFEGRVYPVAIEGVMRDTCCAGCQAVAQAIADNGLASYYRERSAPPPKSQLPSELLDALGVYDLPEIQRSFVRTDPQHGLQEASLLIDGITCAACVWLIERRLAQLPGVRRVAINFGVRRARVAWDDQVSKLSDILRAVTQLGYGVQPYDSARSEDGLRRERRSMLRRLFVSGFGMMQVMMYAVPAYLADDAMTADIEQLMRLASLVLTAPVALWAALPFYRGAWRELKSRRIGMDLPVALGLIAAFAASVYSTARGSGAVYFDSVSMFVFLLLGARLLELNARTKAAAAQQRLARLVPATAERVDRYPNPLVCETVPVARLEHGDIVLVRAGNAIPADGIVIDGASAADEALLTGESRPISKRAGDNVIGGSLNMHGPLTIKVERVGEETVLAAIVRLTDLAQSAKPAIAVAAERAARWFVAVVIVLAGISAAVWYMIDPSRALWVAISVLIVTCPCALSLATPAVLAAATGRLHRAGVLVTAGHALETLGKATHFVFDKTGTLTLGRLSLVGILPLGPAARERCLMLAAALEAQSEHPLAKAIVAAHARRVTPATQVRNDAGRGVEGRVGDSLFRIGRPDYVAELHGKALPDELAFVSDDVTLAALGDDSGWIALLTFSDTLRADARRLVGQLAAQGKTVCVLSGDRTRRVQHFARELGVSMSRGDATPQEKVDFVAALQESGAVVAMIGDGVNDAPVLARAQVSIAIGGGTQLAHMSSDMIIMSERLQPVLTACDVARASARIIRQNLAWAVAYNAIALPVAVTGHLTPLAAAIGMSVSSLAVVLNALRLAGPLPITDDGVPARPIMNRPLGAA